MEKSDLLDKALELIMGDLDDMEGKGAMSHSADECPDPLTCGAHDSELGGSLTDEKPAVKMGLPSLDGEKSDEPSIDDKGEHGESLDQEDIDALKKLLRS